MHFEHNEPKQIWGRGRWGQTTHYGKLENDKGFCTNMTRVKLNCIYNYSHRTKPEAYKRGFFLFWLIFDSIKDSGYAS